MLKLVLLYVLINRAQGDEVTSNFIIDFFYEKHYMITFHSCWAHADLHYLLGQNAISNKPKEISIHHDNADQYHYLSHLSNDNFFVIDLGNCPSSWRILRKINETLEFRWPLKFLLLVNEEDFDAELTPILGNYTIFPSTEMVVAKRIEDTFELLQPYRIDQDHPIKWENYGTWNGSLLVEYLKNMPISQRRHNLEGAHMNAVLYIEFPDTWNHLEDFKVPRIDTFTKQNYGAMKALMEMCHINVTIIPTNVWGYFNQTTKQWNGLIDIVSKKKAQIAGSSPYFTIQRFAVVDFIKMQNPLEIRFLLKKPPLSYMYNIFTLPFQANVWKALAGLLGIFTVALYLNINWESKHYEKINNKDDFTSSDITLIIFEAICQQGSTTECKTASGRVLTLFMFISLMFLYCSYSAYIVVLLQSTHTIVNYQELLDSNIAAGGMETSYMRVYLAGSKKKIQQELYDQKIGPKGFYTLEEGMAKVQAGFFAFHAEVSGSYDFIVEKFTDYEICNVQVMEGLMKVDEYGIQRRNYLRYIRKPTCYSGGGAFDSVGIIDSYNALLIWSFGVGIAIGFFVLEVLAFKCKHKLYNNEVKLRKKNQHGQVALQYWR